MGSAWAETDGVRVCLGLTKSDQLLLLEGCTTVDGGDRLCEKGDGGEVGGWLGWMEGRTLNLSGRGGREDMDECWCSWRGQDAETEVIGGGTQVVPAPNGRKTDLSR